MRYRYLKPSLMQFGAILCLTLSGAAHAIDKAGNGGGLWVCRSPDGAIRWEKAVDLYEAVNEMGLTLGQHPGSYTQTVDQMDRRLRSIDPELHTLLAPYLQGVDYLRENPPSLVYTNADIERIYDSHYRISPSPSECSGGTLSYGQMINYSDRVDSNILVQRELWNHLSNTEKAAMVFHEAFYKLTRTQFGSTDSVKARKLTGILFSTLSDQEAAGQIQLVFSDLKPESVYSYQYDSNRSSTLGNGDVFLLHSGIYSVPPSDPTSSTQTAIQIEVDQQKRTVAVYDIGPLHQLYKDLSERQTHYDCSKTDSRHCEDLFRVISSKGIIYYGYTRPENSPGLMQLQSVPDTSLPLYSGESFKTDFKHAFNDVYPEDDVFARGVGHIGTSQLKVLAPLPGGGWEVELSGNPDNSNLGTDGVSTDGIGLTGPVRIDLDHWIGSGIWKGSQSTTVQLKNGIQCKAEVSLELIANADGKGTPAARIFLPAYTSPRSANNSFFGIHVGPNVEERIDSCEKMNAGDPMISTTPLDQTVSSLQ